MRTNQNFRLSLAALLLCTTTAGAADLKPPPLRNVDAPVLACPEYGAGFFRVPGQDICLKAAIDVTGYAMVDGAKRDLYIETARVVDTPIAYYDRAKIDRSVDRLQSHVDAQLNFTTISRVGTEPLITYISFRNSKTLTAATARNGTDTAFEQLNVDQAWVKFMGFTAGRIGSFFNFTPGYNYTGGYASQQNLNLFAYTQTFGKTASLSLSVEDQSERRVSEGVWASYAGQRLPDVVAQARYLPSWGILHAAAALHEIADGLGTKSAMAYAANVGVEYRQKWAEIFGQAAADTYGRFLFNGAYTNGALSYLGIPKFGTDYISQADGKISRTSGYSGVVSYEHVWKPNFKTMISYSVYGLHSNVPNFDFRVRGSVAQIGAEYMPVSGLMVGTELNYFRDSVRGIYFGVPGNRDKVDILTGYAYVRRRI